MENFIYQVPTKIIFGRKAEENTGNEVKNFTSKILLHYGGGSIKRSGLYAKIISSLNTAGIEYVELSGVKPNPRLSLVKKGIEICKKENISFILAVGGGSVIDSSKAIALGVKSTGDFWQKNFLDKEDVTAALDIGVVLTIPAAGSESSVGTVITNEESGRKVSAKGVCLIPKFSILNPELTTTLPDFQTACGASDMLAHIMERYFSNSEHVDVTDEMCEGVMRAIIRNAPLVLADPQNYDYRAEIMLAGMVAHNNSLGIGRRQDWMSHSLAHELGAKWDIAHGEALAIIFPAWIEFCADANIARFTRFTENVCGIKEGTEKEKIAGAISFLRKWFRDLGLKTHLQEYDFFDEKMIPYFAEMIIGDRPRGGMKVLNTAAVETIYRLAR